MVAFTTTAGPHGWSLGRWVQTGRDRWEEQKLDGQGSFQFQVLNGPPTPGSGTIRMRFVGGGTEVILVGQTVQVFSQGNYMGEYVGFWEQEGQPGQPPMPAAHPVIQENRQSFSQNAPPPPPMRQSRGSIQEVQSMKSAPPPGAQQQMQQQQMQQQQMAPAYAQQAPPAYAQQAPPAYAQQAPPAYAQQAPPAYAQQAPPGAYGQQAYEQQPPPGYGQQAYGQAPAFALADQCPIQVKMFVQGVDYSSLSADDYMTSQFEAAMKMAVADGRDIVEDEVVIEMENGSVIVKTGMSAASGDHGALLADLKSSQGQLAAVATDTVLQLPGIEAVTNGDVVVAVLDVKAGKSAGLAPPVKKKVQHAPPAQSRLKAAAKRKPQKPANLDKTPATGDLLIAAAKAGEASKLQRLLAVGADPDCFGTGGPSAGTAIFYAAEGGHVKAVQTLIDSFADANIPAKGATPMQVAFQKGHKEVLQKLFGATFNTLDTAVTQSGSQVLGVLPGGDDLGYGEEDELPPGAADELAAATKRLAQFGKPQDKENNKVEDELRLPSSNEASLAREAAVKGALKSILPPKKQGEQSPRK